MKHPVHSNYKFRSRALARAKMTTLYRQFPGCHVLIDRTWLGNYVVKMWW